ncbi:hypothetical protein ACFL4X_01190 [Gemmatimonadota bacterium]
MLGRAENLLRIPIFPRDRILSATSSDGINWRRNAGVAVDVKGEHGSEMVYWPHVVQFDGFKRMYFMGSHLVGGNWRERILSAISVQGGEWTIEPGERISPDSEQEGRKVYSPWIVPISRGYRMYYSAKNDYGRTNILSAVSSDGIEWTREPGIRLSTPSSVFESVSGPSVIRRNGDWLMFCTCGTGCISGIGKACSEDGLNWVLITERQRDVINPGPRMSACNPSIVQLNDGTLRMYFSGHDETVNTSRIYVAESRDGNVWDAGRQCLDHSGNYERHGVDFCHAVNEADGNWLLYYTGFWGRHILSPITLMQYRRKAKIRRVALEQDKQPVQ